MNCICKPIVITLLENAAFNGSNLAKMSLDFILSKEEIVSKSICNYFDAIKSYDEGEAVFSLTACMKDINNPNFPGKDDPNCMWEDKYRTIVNIQLLLSRISSIKTFRLENPKLFESELLFLNEIFGLPKFKITVSDKEEDFFNAYYGANYSISKSQDATLHNSCMRYIEKAKICANFYAKLAKCKILYVTDINNKEIYGRAIVWDNVKFETRENIFVNTLMDRVYYSNTGVRILIDHYAKQNNWIKKTKNTYDSKIYFSKVNTSNGEWVEFISKAYYDFCIEDTKEYIKGAPYLDTFSYLIIDKINKKIRFHNVNDNDICAVMTSTRCKGSINNICPICGKFISSDFNICSDCRSNFSESFGFLISKQTKTIDGIEVPIELIDPKTNKLNPFVRIHSLLQKINTSDLE